MRTFPWLEAPEEPATARAEQILRDLGAADPITGQITELGQRMVSFPMQPRYARMLMAGHIYGCTREAALIAALTQTQDVLIRRPPRHVQEARERVLGDRSDSISSFSCWSGAAQQHGYSPMPASGWAFMPAQRAR